MEILPRFKIQYPMKNRNKYTLLFSYKKYPYRGIFEKAGFTPIGH